MHGSRNAGHLKHTQIEELLTPVPSGRARMMPSEQREAAAANASTPAQACDTVERLKRAPWNRKLTTARLMALTRDLRPRLIAPE